MIVATCLVDFPYKNKVLDDQREAGDYVGSKVGQHSRILRRHDVQRATQWKNVNGAANGPNGRTQV